MIRLRLKGILVHTIPSVFTIFTCIDDYKFVTFLFITQESPPAGNRTRRTACSVTCRGGGGGLPLSWLVVPLSWPRKVPQAWPSTGVPPLPARTGVSPLKGPGTRDLEKNLALRYPPPPGVWMDKQSENITFPHPSECER